MAFLTDGKHFGQYTYEHWFDHEYGNNIMDYYQESVDAGFTKIENTIGRTWNNKNDESALASLCR